MAAPVKDRGGGNWEAEDSGIGPTNFVIPEIGRVWSSPGLPEAEPGDPLFEHAERVDPGLGQVAVPGMTDGQMLKCCSPVSPGMTVEVRDDSAAYRSFVIPEIGRRPRLGYPCIRPRAADRWMPGLGLRPPSGMTIETLPGTNA
jgi:hypothetical protein